MTTPFSPRLGLAVLTATHRNSSATDAEAERLRKEVFSNEKGFLKSTDFNPTRAREKEDEEEAKRLSMEWGSTPEKTRDVMEKTKAGHDLSFQVRRRPSQPCLQRGIAARVLASPWNMPRVFFSAGSHSCRPQCALAMFIY